MGETHFESCKQNSNLECSKRRENDENEKLIHTDTTKTADTLLKQLVHCNSNSTDNSDNGDNPTKTMTK